MDRQGEHDLIEDFALPLAIQVICELMGVPPAERMEFRHWSGAIVSATVSEEEYLDARTRMLAYVRGLLAAKRAEPADDLLSALADSGLTPDEITSTVVLFLVAGHDTTLNMISSGTYRLLADRTQWERLTAEPGLVPAAVEEMLRYDSPLQAATHRVTTADVEVAGRTIPAGSVVLLSLLSANRDEDHFPAAGTFDIGQSAPGHVAFGHGIHYCLGAPLARLEGQIAFTLLPARFPGLRLAAGLEPRWRVSHLMRGLTALPVLI